MQQHMLKGPFGRVPHMYSFFAISGNTAQKLLYYLYYERAVMLDA